MSGSSIASVSAVNSRGGGYAAVVVVAAAAVVVPIPAITVEEGLGCEGCCLLESHM